MEDVDKNDPEARLALILLRHSLLLDQAGFARAARIAPSQLSVYERGERAAPREVLEKAATAAGFPIPLLDSLLRGIRSFRAATRGRSRPGRALADGLAAELITLARSAIDVALEPLTETAPPDLEDDEERSPGSPWDRRRPAGLLP